MEETVNADPATPTEDKTSFRYFPFFSHGQPIFVLVLIGLIFYCTTLYNEYALDDGIIIHQNSYVLKGIRGIKDILTRDAYDSFYKRMNAKDQLQGGRYRPLPIVSFAIEQEIIGRYRTGYYQFVEDLNQNGRLDYEQVIYTRPALPRVNGASLNFTKNHIKTEGSAVAEYGYEYNHFVDRNHDGLAQPDECNNCWDTNRDFRNEAKEDLNQDGIFNEVDCQVQGSFFRHFNNMWMYVIACVLLYIVFRNYFFKNNNDMAFLAALIFIAHPLHSEVVANIKSRDEILCMAFIASCFYYVFRYVQHKKMSSLFLAGLMMLLSLLSKEFGILLLVLVPIALYVFEGSRFSMRKMLLPAIGFIFIAGFMIWVDVKSNYFGLPPAIIFVAGVLLYSAIVALTARRTLESRDVNALMVVLFGFTLIYLAMRLYSVNMAPGVADTEILNNPFLLATGEEKFATKVLILLKYLKLTFFPHPLISDYSYNSIIYRHFTDWDFILSAFIHTAMIVSAVILVRRRHVLGFAIITYLLTLLLVGNFLFATGAAMLEGNLFQPTIGFAMAMGWLIITGLDKFAKISFNSKRTAFISLLLIVIVLYGAKTWERNWDWKNDVTLFLKDVKNAPNSVLVLGNAGARWIDLADTREITGIPFPGQNPNVFNDYNGQLKITEEEVKAGNYKSKKEAALMRGIGYLKHAVELHPRYVNGYLNLGLASFKLGNDYDCVYYWKIAEHLYPDNPYLLNYYQVYTGLLKKRGDEQFKLGQYNEAAIVYTMWTIVTPQNADAWYNLGSAYYHLGHHDKAKKCFEKALALNPADQDIQVAIMKVK
jgi:tetratricopeptide (TPR) repeat protein